MRRRCSPPSNRSLDGAARHRWAAIRPTVIGDDTFAYKVIRGKLPRGLRIALTSGVMTGKPRTAIRKPHIIAVAGVWQDGSLGVANPLRSQSAGTPCVRDAHWRNRPRMTRRRWCSSRTLTALQPGLVSDCLTPTPANRIHRKQVADLSIF